MGDLGMHALHIPLRAGWEPRTVHAVLSDVVSERPGPDGATVPCDTPDNAVLTCVAEDARRAVPAAAGDEADRAGRDEHVGDRGRRHRGLDRVHDQAAQDAARMDYAAGGPQEWSVLDLGSQSAYPTVTGAIFETGFSDAIQQMLAAFLDELAHGRDGMRSRSTARRPARRGRAPDLHRRARVRGAGRLAVCCAPRPDGADSRAHRRGGVSEGRG